jgi:hypothetical protein
MMLMALIWGAGQPVATQSPLGLVLLVATDAPEYRPGAAITFTLAVENPSDAPTTVETSSAQLFDVQVFDGEHEVWRWSADRDFADAETERTFPPGLTLLDHVTWNGRDTSGKVLSVGTYRAVGSLTTTGAPHRGNEILIRLVDTPQATPTP